MGYIALLSDGILNGFALVTITLLIGRIVWPGNKAIIKRLVTFSNTLLIVGAILYLSILLQQFVSQLYAGDEYESYALINRIIGPYWWAYWGAVLFRGVLPQLLWIQKLRHSLNASLALLPFLLVEYWLPLLAFVNHRDYLPTSWFVMQPNCYGLAITCIIYLLFFPLLFGATQLIKNKFFTPQNPR